VVPEKDEHTDITCCKAQLLVPVIFSKNALGNPPNYGLLEVTKTGRDHYTRGIQTGKENKQF